MLGTRSVNFTTVRLLNLERSAEEQKWIVKDINPSNFDYLLDIYRGLSGCPYLRLVHDTVPSQSTFIFKYCTGTLLDLGHRDLTIALTKRILNDTLRGLAALHDRDVVHNGNSMPLRSSIAADLG